MTVTDKLISKIFNNGQISYQDAEKILLNLGFQLKTTGSHHIFRKNGYQHNITLKRRPQLLMYQLKQLKEVLIDHGYTQ